MVNGFTNLNLTKVDVFTGYPNVKIGLAYRDKKSGKVVENRMPASLKVRYLIDCFAFILSLSCSFLCIVGIL